MNRIKSLKIKNFKHIGNSYVGFDRIKNLNILVGQNNIGKSTLLQSIEILMSGDAIFEGITEETRINFGFSLDEDSIRSHFHENSYGGAIDGNHWKFGKNYIGKSISYEFQPRRMLGKEQIALFSISDIMPEELNRNKRIEKFIDLADRFLSYNFRRLKVVKLSADRNLLPEIQSRNIDVLEDGTGATNLLRQYLNVLNLPNDVVENDILNALNRIMKPENHFKRIMCQEIGTNDYDDPKWEILLVNENGKIPISSSGSGLKTVLLVLIKLFLETRGISGYNLEQSVSDFIFIFEELENNLHPAIQRNLFDFLYQWSIENDTLIFLTTHSTVPINMFSGKANVTLTHIKKENQTVVTNSALSFIENSDILVNLGVRASDILQSNAVIWVEGPSDRSYINRWIELYSNGVLRENIHYQILFYGGRLLSHLTGKVNDSSELIQLFRANVNAIIVIDSDKTDSKKQINRTKQRIKREFDNNQAIVWITKGKEIENYLSRKIFKKKYKIDKQIGQYEKIDEFLNNNSKNKKQGNYYVRNKVSESIEIAKLIEKEDLLVLDLEKQIYNVINKIKLWNGL
ncbi:AAA family ATPase [Streptococcus mitis]|jgi:putative ATP/GTP-binding protein|uniref:ATP-dependent nuclease n=1 Tax=Streptococcus TaxID=1301 RepID=UPI001CE4B41E|nr:MULTISPECIES: ATP-binding protein [Streptococcus]MCG4864242.1 AAA family ATPase [Streptococcus mitis]